MRLNFLRNNLTIITFLLDNKSRRGGLVVSTLDFRSRGQWFKPGHCVLEVSGSSLVTASCCFLRQETLLHIVSLHPGV